MHALMKNKAIVIKVLFHREKFCRYLNNTILISVLYESGFSRKTECRERKKKREREVRRGEERRWGRFVKRN